MAQARTQKGAFFKALDELVRLERELKFAWSKTNPEEFERITKLNIETIKKEIALGESMGFSK